MDDDGGTSRAAATDRSSAGSFDACRELALMSDSAKLCPSSRCEPGNILIGLVNAAGRIDFIPERVEIDAQFVAAAHEGRPPEQRFRFSSHCLKRGCEKWDGERCGVAKILHERGPELLSAEPPAALPRCSIRPQCRWHGEYGDSICFTCSWVITERDGP